MPIIGGGGVLYVAPAASGLAFAAAAASNSGATDSASDWSPTMPSGIASGNLLVAVVGQDDNAGISASTGWTSLDTDNQFTSVGGSVFYRVADGGANDTLTLTPGASNQFAAVVARFTGASSWSLSSTSGNNAGFDPPSHDAGSSAATIWIAALVCDRLDEPTGAPTNYENLTVASSAGTSSCTASIATRALTAQTEDPGAFTITSTEQNVVFTIAARSA